MKTSELRIGNWVTDVVNGLIKVKMLPNQQEISVNPITLNEEWLLKFGFFRHNNAYVLEKPKDNTFDFDFSIWHDMTYNSSEFSVKLKSVHQLQNLYFALVCEELKLTKQPTNE